MVHRLAGLDDRIIFIGSDLGPGVLDGMRVEMPDRFFMEGVAEANVIGMAAGLAMDGFVPYVNTIATFLTRRCYEQVAVDLCLHDLPVRLIGNGGGMVYAPLGPTHLATEDIAIMRALPNMAVVAPADAKEMQQFMQASKDWPHPIYIRLGKGGDPVLPTSGEPFEMGRGMMIRDGSDVAMLSTGVMTSRALQAAQQLEKSGIDAAVYHFPTIKPIDEALLVDLAARFGALVTVEEHVLSGGFGSAVVETLVDAIGGPLPTIRRIGLPDAFPRGYGSQEELMARYGLDAPAIAESVRHHLDGRQ